MLKESKPIWDWKSKCQLGLKKKKAALQLIRLGGQTQIKPAEKLTGNIVFPKVMQQL